ncbi:uncharacterized protein LOC126379738 [Pectinophora gossypiella]|uniref:uncharacterized protein LOC126379738 n=1 Tax=Pectinophora gossypiella TaxID=13191 RepID=UPI00214EAC7E|nr:uncharacterized protein LOC126379738 [Pectinophora gossypiella]
MGKGAKKRKKKIDSEEAGSDSSADYNSMKSFEVEPPKDKYEVFKIPDYVRYYPEDGGNFEYVVFMESTKPEQPLGARDMMSLANSLKRYNKGVKQLQRINKFKIGVIFERPGLANAALTNKKFLDSHSLKASIPASSSEVTGVITHVPTDLSNEQIYSALTSTKNIVTIRRFMRRVKNDFGEFNLEPTKTVSITFSCPNLPESVDLNSWRFELRPYIPPVKQCLKCLRYGHIAKFCKNAERCSICGESHNFKVCTKLPKDASCCHCKGNHIAISSQCPVKKEQIELNKQKVETRSYASIINQKSFPPLKQHPTDLLASLLNSDQILNMVVESVVKLVAMHKNSEASICSQSIKDTLLDTIKRNKKSQ